MKIRSIAAIISLSLSIFAPASSDAAPDLTPSPGIARPRMATKLTMADASVAVGESKSFPASLLTADGKAVANKKLSVSIMTMPGKVLVGSLNGETDASGHASIKLSATFGGAGKNLLVLLRFKGDQLYGESEAEATITVTKAPLKINLGDLTMVPGKGPMITVALQRATDGKEAVAPIALTVNGAAANLTGQATYSAMLTPANATSWDVKATSPGGDDVLAGTQARVYTRPN